MHAKDVFAKAVQQATSCVRHVNESHLQNPTPCSEWDLGALLNHMVYELLWVPEIIRGKTVQDVGDLYEGDVLRSNPQATWQHVADAALAAVHNSKESQIAHVSYGDVPLMLYILEVGGDQLIHAWDLGQAMKATVLFDNELAQVVYEDVCTRQPQLEASGSFAPALKVAADASIQDKLLALTGRRPDWQ
jgi:uncharacterized protein (TIGR03086 family)